MNAFIHHILQKCNETFQLTLKTILKNNENFKLTLKTTNF